MEKYEDLRKYKRIKVNFNVQCFIGDSASIEIDVDSADLSEGGMRIVVPRELIVGSQVVMVFYLPNAETRRKLQELIQMHLKTKDKNYGKDRLEIEAEVVWVNKAAEKENWYAAGVRFLFMDESRQALLREFIVQHEKGIL